MGSSLRDQGETTQEEAGGVHRVFQQCSCHSQQLTESGKLSCDCRNRLSSGQCFLDKWQTLFYSGSGISVLGRGLAAYAPWCLGLPSGLVGWDRLTPDVLWLLLSNYLI